MLGLFSKFIAILESLIAVLILNPSPVTTPLPEPTPAIVVQGTSVPTPEITPSPTPIVNNNDLETPLPIPTPTPTPEPTPAPKIEDVIIQLEELKKEIANFTPVPTPLPATPEPTPIPTVIATPEPTPVPTPKPPTVHDLQLNTVYPDGSYSIYFNGNIDYVKIYKADYDGVTWSFTPLERSVAIKSHTSNSELIIPDLDDVEHFGISFYNTHPQPVSYRVHNISSGKSLHFVGIKI